MRPYLVLLLNICELSAVIVGIYHWKKIKTNYWKWFLIYLMVIFVVEMTGKYFNMALHRTDLNNYLYSFLGIPIQFLFFFWLFGKQANNKNDKAVVAVSACIYVLSVFADHFYFSEMKNWFSSFSYTLGNLLLVILLIRYLLRFINSDEILNFRQSMMFWVAVGLAIFYLGSLPFFALRNTLYYKFNDIFIIYDVVQLLFGCLMYLVFALSFKWGKPK